MIIMNTNKLEITTSFCPKWTSVLRELIAMDYFYTLEKNEGKGGMFTRKVIASLMELIISLYSLM